MPVAKLMFTVYNPLIAVNTNAFQMVNLNMKLNISLNIHKYKIISFSWNSSILQFLKIQLSVFIMI